MKEEKNKPSTVPRPAVPADYLKGRPKVFLKTEPKSNNDDNWAENLLAKERKPKAKQKISRSTIAQPLPMVISEPITQSVTYKEPRKRSKTKKRAIIGIALFGVLAGLSALGFFVWKKDSIKPTATVDKSIELKNDAVIQKPTFTYLYPFGKESETAKISPSGTMPSYAFIDSIEGIQINVTEQQLPTTFEADSAGQLQQLAISDSGTSKTFQVKEIKVYYSINKTLGIQSLFFVKKGLLVLIRAAKQIPDDTWAAYISALN